MHVASTYTKAKHVMMHQLLADTTMQLIQTHGEHLVIILGSGRLVEVSKQPLDRVKTLLAVQLLSMTALVVELHVLCCLQSWSLTLASNLVLTQVTRVLFRSLEM